MRQSASEVMVELPDTHRVPLTRACDAPTYEIGLSDALDSPPSRRARAASICGPAAQRGRSRSVSSRSPVSWGQRGSPPGVLLDVLRRGTTRGCRWLPANASGQPIGDRGAVPDAHLAGSQAPDGPGPASRMPRQRSAATLIDQANGVPARMMSSTRWVTARRVGL